MVPTSIYTVNPRSDAKGNSAKSPTATTVALPSTNFFAACEHVSQDANSKLTYDLPILMQIR